MELKPGYKQTEVGVIPEDWETGSLGKFWSIIDCKHVTASFIPSGYPIASIREVQSKYVNLSSCKYTDKYFYRLLVEGGRQPRAGDLIMSRNATVGEVAQVTDAHPDFAMGQDICLLQRRRKEYSATYLQALLQSPSTLEQLASMMVGSTFKRANVEQIRSLKVAMPPPREQKAIAEQIDCIDEYISMAHALISKKRAIKQAAMQELLTGKRRLPGFEEEWAQVSLGSVAAMNSGGTPPTGRDDFYGGGIPWVSISDMTSSSRFISETERTLSDLGLANCSAKRFPAGTILYAMYASIGECSIAAREVTTSQAILGIRPGPSLVGEYLYYWLESIRAAVKLLGQQGTQSNLNKKIVQGFSLGLPSKPEQAAIAKVLGEIDQDIDALKVKTEKTLVMKAGIMQQLLTGKIRLA